MELTKSELFALTTRADILASECEIVQEKSITWFGRWRQVEGWHTGGGSSEDRKQIISAMAKLESKFKRPEGILNKVPW